MTVLLYWFSNNCCASSTSEFMSTRSLKEPLHFRTPHPIFSLAFLCGGFSEANLFYEDWTKAPTLDWLRIERASGTGIPPISSKSHLPSVWPLHHLLDVLSFRARSYHLSPGSDQLGVPFFGAFHLAPWAAALPWPTSGASGVRRNMEDGG